MTYCPAPGVLFVDVSLVVKEFWYDLDSTLSTGIHQWRHMISEKKKITGDWNTCKKWRHDIWNKHIKIIMKTISWQPHLTSTHQSTRTCLVTKKRSFIPFLHMFLWNVPNNEQIERSIFNKIGDTCRYTDFKNLWTIGPTFSIASCVTFTKQTCPDLYKSTVSSRKNWNKVNSINND